MDGWMIAVLAVVFVVIIVSLVYGFLYVKKKIRNKLIDKGADIITKTAGKVLDEEAASKVNSATNVTAKMLKMEKSDLIMAAAKKGLEIAKENKKEKK